MKKRYKLLIILALLIGPAIFYSDELWPMYYMHKGDYASKCAAIYSVKEPSLLGQIIEFVIFVNPIDESESELASMIRLFHNIAAEYYQLAGEPSELASNLADYSIVEYIHQFSNLKQDGDKFETHTAKLLNNCNITLSYIQENLQQQ